MRGGGVQSGQFLQSRGEINFGMMEIICFLLFKEFLQAPNFVTVKHGEIIYKCFLNKKFSFQHFLFTIFHKNSIFRELSAKNYILVLINPLAKCAVVVGG